MLDSTLALYLVPVVWGATFPAAKIVLRHMPIASFMAWTRGTGLLAIAAATPLLRRTEARAVADERPPARSVLLPALVLGTLIFASYTLQTEGLARTTATNAGFITGLYVVFTPLIAALVLRRRVPGIAWVAIAASVAGLALLSVKHLATIRPHVGDLLVLAGAVGWACHITVMERASRRFPVWMLSTAQMAVTAILQVGAALATAGLRPADALSARVWPLLVLTGVFGSGLAYTMQIVAQQRMTSTRAVVLLGGEALFSALFAAVWIGERLAPHQWLGAALVLGAMVVSELAARGPSAVVVEPASAE